MEKINAKTQQFDKKTRKKGVSGGEKSDLSPQERKEPKTHVIQNWPENREHLLLRFENIVLDFFSRKNPMKALTDIEFVRMVERRKWKIFYFWGSDLIPLKEKLLLWGSKESDLWSVIQKKILWWAALFS